jgi:two-component system, LytTR family, response regulator
MTIRVLVADDEKAARSRLVRLLGAMGDAEIAGEAPDGAAAIAQVKAIKPDVVFLDIEMPEGSGLDVAQAVASKSGPAIVFVTAFDQYAVRAFDVHAVDYLLKPVAEDRLAIAWNRVRDHLRSGDPGAARVLAALEEMKSAPVPAYRERMLATRDGRSTIIAAADVEWVEAAANYVKLHVAGGSHTIRETIGTMEAQLDPRRFARIHRGAIVNIDQVREIQPWFSGDQVLIMRSGKKLKLSRTYRKAFESRFSTP